MLNPNVPNFYATEITRRSDGLYNVWSFFPESKLSPWPYGPKCYTGRWIIVSVRKELPNA